MKKLFTLSILSVFSIFNCISQDRFGNEWIKYDQKYLKIAVDSKGIFRISKTEIVNAGFPTNLLNDPSKFQLIFRGKEMAINVNTGADAIFDNADYIEFFGKNNDGALDNEVYRPKNTKPHPYFSIYTDESYYFFTVGTANGKRISIGPTANTGLIADANYKGEHLKAFVSENNFDATRNFPYPSLQHCVFDPNELWCSRAYNWAYPTGPNDIYRSFSENATITNLDPNYINTVEKIQFEAMVVGRSFQTSLKEIKVQAGNEFATASIPADYSLPYFGYENKKVNFTVNSITGSSLPVSMIQTKSGSSTTPVRDFFAVCYYLIKYPKLFSFENNSEYLLNPNPSNISRLTITNSSAPIFGLDISDYENPKNITINDGAVANTKDVYVDGTITSKRLFLTTATKTVKRINSVQFGTNGIKLNPSLYDYIIITDGSLRSGADTYANYRESTVGGLHKPVVLETKNIYDEYFYGERSPAAIKRLADYLHEFGDPKYLFLIGNGYSFEHDMKIKPELDLVPTFGFPASDIFLTSEVGGFPANVPSIPTSRLPVSTNQEILNYLDKVKMHELTRPLGGWQRNLIHIVGNKFAGEETSLKATLDELLVIARNSTFNANDTNYPTLLKLPGVLSDVDINNNPANDFYTKINNGAGIVTYFGHGSANNITQQFGNVSDGARGYIDNDKFNLLYANGCGISNTFQDNQSSITKKWVLTPHRGSILALGQSFLSFEATDTKYMKLLYQGWLNGTSPGAKKNSVNFLNSGMGDVVQSTHQQFATTYGVTDPYNTSNLQIVILFGDPAVSLLKPAQNLQALPLSILDFKSNVLSKGIELSWKDANFENIEKYEIERSSDSKKFVKIGEVYSSSLESDYKFEDAKPENGINYYRLKVTEKDKKTDYSEILAEVYNDGSVELLKIKGNPIQNNIIEFELSNIDSNSLNLFDSFGKEVSYTLELNKNKILLTEKLSAGIYYLKIKDLKGKLFVSKIVVR